VSLDATAAKRVAPPLPVSAFAASSVVPAVPRYLERIVRNSAGTRNDRIIESSSTLPPFPR
jgi:hypothetical protein